MIFHDVFFVLAYLGNAFLPKFTDWQGPKNQGLYWVRDGARKTGGPIVGPLVLRAALWTRMWSLIFGCPWGLLLISLVWRSWSLLTLR